MLLNAAVIAALIFIFARYNAEGGLLRSFLMLLGVTLAWFLIMWALPPSVYFLGTPIYLLLLAAGLTFICGTQPKQTGQIIGIFVLFRALLWGLSALILKSV